MNMLMKRDTLVTRIPHGGFAQLDPGGVQWHVSILGATAQQDVLELLQIALLA